MTPGIAFLAGLALVAGSVLFVAFALVVATVVAVKIDPGPDVPPRAQVERAELHERERGAHEDALDRLERERGRERVVGSPLVFPVFAVVFALFMLFGAWTAVADHADAGGGPVSASLLLRPLWLPWIPASLSALIIAANRRRNWERWPQWRKDREIERRREKERRGRESRLASLRRAVSPRRTGRY